jgi:hypothetical protein
MTPFCFEHVFRAPSVDDVFAAYFDAEQQRDQDRANEIVERAVLELAEHGDELRRVCRVVPRRRLPAFVRPLVPGQLHYIEHVTWKRRANMMELDIRPSLLGGRVQILGTYSLESAGAGTVRRRYSGQVSVDIAFVASRIERGIVAELDKTLPIAAASTQAWLDRQPSRSVSARA